MDSSHKKNIALLDFLQRFILKCLCVDLKMKEFGGIRAYRFIKRWLVLDGELLDKIVSQTFQLFNLLLFTESKFLKKLHFLWSTLLQFDLRCRHSYLIYLVLVVDVLFWIKFNLTRGNHSELHWKFIIERVHCIRNRGWQPF